MSTLNGRGLRTVSAKTANYTVVTPNDNGKTFTNEGASGAVVFALPAATVGQWYRFNVLAAQALRIDPNGTETVALPTTGAQQAAGKYMGVSTVGYTVTYVCLKAGQWDVEANVGTWVVEP
jgi:hypothetical protein